MKTRLKVSPLQLISKKGVEGAVDDFYFKGKTKVSYTETTYHIVPSLVDGLTTSIQRAYGDLPSGVLCRNFAAQKCYEETI